MRGIFIALALAALSGAAHAEGSSGTKEEQAACRPDVRKLCGSIGKADEQKYHDCLQGHFAALSPKCQQVLSSHQSSN